jgi:hypothetical protein
VVTVVVAVVPRVVDTVDVADVVNVADGDDVAVDVAVDEIVDVSVVEGDVFSHPWYFPSLVRSIRPLSMSLLSLQSESEHEMNPPTSHVNPPSLPFGPSYSFTIRLSPSTMLVHDVAPEKEVKGKPVVAAVEHDGVANVSSHVVFNNRNSSSCSSHV